MSLHILNERTKAAKFHPELYLQKGGKDIEKTIHEYVTAAVKDHYAHLMTKSKEDLIQDSHHITNWFTISDWFLNQDEEDMLKDETALAFFATRNVVQELYEDFRNNYETPDDESIGYRYEEMLEEHQQKMQELNSI